jgi:hypothetical protein
MESLGFIILWFKIILIGMFIWGTYLIFNFFFLSDKIETKVPLKPEIQINIVDGKADTTYIYTIN